MPTIDQLPATPACSDTDLLMVSQSGIARQATRAQVLAGVQPALLPPGGTLLGRQSAGFGVPETIGVGANLTLAEGMLSAPAPFTIAGLPAGTPPAATDLIPVAQGGGAAVLSYDALLRGLPTLEDVSGANLLVGGAAPSVVRTLADALAVAVPVEAFGATGDGVTDDTAAFVSAFANGTPVRLDGRTYVVNGPLTITEPAALCGVAGSTRLLRLTAPGMTGPWLAFSAAVEAIGVCFDAGSVAVADGAAVALQPGCLSASFRDCAFTRATGANAGNGLLVSADAAASVCLHRCIFSGNAASGCDAVSGGTLELFGCTLTGNGGAGLQNAASVTVSAIGNTVSANGGAGLLITGDAALVMGNRVIASSGSPAIQAILQESTVHANIVSDGSCGLDLRGSVMVSVEGNQVLRCTTCIDVGGCQNVRVAGNILSPTGTAISIRNIESSASTLPVSALSVEDNWIGLATATSAGIAVLDAAQGVAVRRNALTGWGSASPEQALHLHTDAIIVQGNTWNNQARWPVTASSINGTETLVVPDMADEVQVLSADSGIASVVTEHQLAMRGALAFIKVTSGGSGYSTASIQIGGNGTGASAIPLVAGGSVIGVQMIDAGAGYAGTPLPPSVTITGDGSGAAAVSTVGLPVIEGRKLRVSCNVPVQFCRNGSAPFQENWTLNDLMVPAFSSAVLEGTLGEWRIVGTPPVDYLAPNASGGVALRSLQAGDVLVHPAGTGRLSVVSDIEAVGFSSSLGRGSPVGVVTAAPGSDYRNLQGGPGQTLWIKQSGTDASGWVAIA